ncbi:hypothetical protein ABZ297_46320 [Nonomuraea sp. NPDC005983]|uniref:hypothetical protein n=1 Tax=Nonomuraea sp. NPDC005983 TaxID=3155595 RepID=UPI0033AFA6BF
MAEHARPSRIPVTMLVVLAVVLAAGVVWAYLKDRDAQARADDRDAALRAAGNHAVSLLSLNYKTIDADMRRILATSTGGARSAYEANAGRLKETTVANKVIQYGVLRASGMVSQAETSAQVLVVADVDIRWDGSKTPAQERFYRWAMDVTKVGGVWLVSKAVQVE